MAQDFLQNNIVAEDMLSIFKQDISWNDIDNCTVLITGATGMLASYFVFFLIWLNEMQKKHIRIIVLVRNEKKCFCRFGEYVKKEYFSIFTDPIEHPLCIEQPIDYIIHAASLASPQYYGPKPVEVAIPNAVGTYQVLELARKKKCKGILYFSTGDIYGTVDNSIKLINEDTLGKINPLDPHSCYGESKRMGETWCASYAREFGLSVKIVRIWHTYSPTMDIKNDPRVFSSFMKCLCGGKNLVMLSDGTTKRTFCYIADAIAGFLLVLLKGEKGEAYNVSNSDQFLSIAELAEIVAAIAPNKKLKVVYKKRKNNEDYMENLCNRMNRPSNAKLTTLGWKCKYDVKHGFKNVFDYISSVN